MWNRVYNEDTQVYDNYNQYDETDVWVEYYDDDGNLYYYKEATGETLWELPIENDGSWETHDTGYSGYYGESYENTEIDYAQEELSGQEASDGSVWQTYHDEATGQPYYINIITQESAWELPSGLGEEAHNTSHSDQRYSTVTAASFYESEYQSVDDYGDYDHSTLGYEQQHTAGYEASYDQCYDSTKQGQWDSAYDYSGSNEYEDPSAHESPIEHDQSGYQTYEIPVNDSVLYESEEEPPPIEEEDKYLQKLMKEMENTQSEKGDVVDPTQDHATTVDENKSAKQNETPGETEEKSTHSSPEGQEGSSGDKPVATDGNDNKCEGAQGDETETRASEPLESSPKLSEQQQTSGSVDIPKDAENKQSHEENLVNTAISKDVNENPSAVTKQTEGPDIETATNSEKVKQEENLSNIPSKKGDVEQVQGAAENSKDGATTLPSLSSETGDVKDPAPLNDLEHAEETTENTKGGAAEPSTNESTNDTTQVAVNEAMNVQTQALKVDASKENEAKSTDDVDKAATTIPTKPSTPTEAAIVDKSTNQVKTQKLQKSKSERRKERIRQKNARIQKKAQAKSGINETKQVDVPPTVKPELSDRAKAKIRANKKKAKSKRRIKNEKKKTDQELVEKETPETDATNLQSNQEEMREEKAKPEEVDYAKAILAQVDEPLGNVGILRKRSTMKFHEIKPSAITKTPGRVDVDRIDEVCHGITIESNKLSKTMETTYQDLYYSLRSTIKKQRRKHKKGTKEVGISRKSLLYILCFDPAGARAKLRMRSLGLDKLFRPREFHKHFAAADKNDDGFLDVNEFVHFCNENRIKGRKLVPYNERVDIVKKQDTNFETILITITIPPEYADRVDSKYQETPYCHFARRKQWENEFKVRNDTWEKYSTEVLESIEQSRKGEMKRRTTFDNNWVKRDQSEIRERKRQRGALCRKKAKEIKHESVRMLLQYVNPEFTAEEVEDEERSPPVLPAIPHIGHAPQASMESFKDVTHHQLLVEKKTFQDVVKSLPPEQKELFQTWREQAEAMWEKRIDAQMEKRILKYVKMKEKEARMESKRRKQFDHDLIRRENEYALKLETFIEETNNMESSESCLRVFEDKTYRQFEHQRNEFLRVVSVCFDRGIMRRLAWRETLKEQGELNRTLHLVSDQLTGNLMTLLTVACGMPSRNKNEGTLVIKAIKVFQDASRKGFVSVAQRKDDRIATSSRYLLEIEDVFSHNLKSWQQVFILSKFHHGGRLKNILHNLYGDINVVSHAPEKYILKWTEQLANAIKALHDRGLAHRGVEPSCIFMDSSYCVKLGPPKEVRAMVVGSTDASPFLLSKYSAPELYQVQVGRRQRFDDPRKADVWSLGAVVYHLTTGSCLPKEFVLSSLLSSPTIGRHQRWIRGFFRMTLQQRPMDRASIVEVCDYLHDNVDQALLVTANRIAEEDFMRRTKKTQDLESKLGIRLM